MQYSDVDKLNFLAIYEDYLCNVSKTCKEFKKKYGYTDFCRESFYYWKNNDPVFAKNLEELELALIDDAEQTLKAEGVLKGNITALIFLLKNKHPDYAEKLNIKANVNYQHKQSERLSRIREKLGDWFKQRNEC